MTTTCTHCSAAITSGGAKGLCARCYQRQRRTGALPVLGVAPAPRLDASVTVRLTIADLRVLLARASAEGTRPADWARRQLLAALAK